VVVGKGLHDELSGEMFAAIQTAHGQGYYLRLPPAEVERLQEHDKVRVGFEVEAWSKPADRIVARFAQENGGIYDPVRHQRALEVLRHSSPAADQPTPTERVTANIRRLERLARYRLAARLPDWRWQIPADLLTKLESRERTHPQHRLRLERIGVPARAPMRQVAPDVAAEREALGRALGKNLGLAYVSEPVAFRGRVVACAPMPSGREYLRIVNERTGQFTLIEKSVGAERLEGQIVQLTRGRERGMSLQIDRGMSR
jgi:hypothetical protein